MRPLAIATIAGALALGPMEAGHAASAVAWTQDFTYAHCSGQSSEQQAIDCALQRCADRAKRPCKLGVSCAQPGHGAVVLRIYPVGEVEGIGAACGAADPAAAARSATDTCNRSTRPGRCEPPAVSWQD
jgi:hypothetical protein